MSLLFFTVLFISVLDVYSVATTDCSTVGVADPSCQCKTTSGFLVDLNQLFQLVKPPAGQQALFSAVGQSKVYNYLYQPCKPFSCSATVASVAACQVSINQPQQLYNIGNPALSTGANFTGNVADNTLNITYIGIGNRYTEVMLRCSSESAKYTALGETNPKRYVLMLETSLVCGQPAGGLSVGSILCIVFAVVVVVYLVAGYFIKYKVYESRGVEAIPNLEFWQDLPSLIKDGFMFVLRGCKTQSDRTYQQI